MDVRRIVISRRTVGMGGGLLLVLMASLPVHGAGVKKGAVTPPSLGGYATDDALNRVVIPAQTPSFVGGQKPPMAVTPGNRFMRILVSHVALWESPETGLAISADQRKRFREILLKTRPELIRNDATDLRLVQLFEAFLVRKKVPEKRLHALNARIGEIEGKEAMEFLSALKELQAVLTAPQIQMLRQKNETELPSDNVSVSSALMFADRMLSIRWQRVMAGSLPAKSREGLARRYHKARNWLWSLAAEKTVSDRSVDDLLSKPFVDMEAFGEIEKKAGPLEGKFWGTFLRIVTLLQSPVG